jgi:hypothetical protein
MYVLIVLTLRVTGKRGVKQLSLFELTIILSLGSAAGDAMFYQDVALLHVLVVFAVVILLYLGFNRLTEQSSKAERWLEGHPSCIIEKGILNMEAFKKENLFFQELFSELRQQHIEHLEQIKNCILRLMARSVFTFMNQNKLSQEYPFCPKSQQCPSKAFWSQGSMRAINVVNANNIYPVNTTSVVTVKIIYG